MLQQLDVHAKRLLDLADFIEDLPEERFSMKQWGQLSEPRCICGWFMHNEAQMHLDNWKVAAERLGLDEATASKLFAPENDWNTVEAARALRHLAISGELIR
jgi:hypothetical protein